MKSTKKSSSFIASFSYAFQGLKYFFSHEVKSKIHFFAMLVCISFGFFFNINFVEWLIILICFSMVFVAEIFNTAIETLCDFIFPDYHLKIKTVKDLVAAAVLMASIFSFIISILIFLPKIFKYFSYVIN